MNRSGVTTLMQTPVAKEQPKPAPCEPPKHRFDTNKRGYIIAERCRCGKMPLRRAR